MLPDNSAAWQYGSTVTGILIAKVFYAKKCHLNCVTVDGDEDDKDAPPTTLPFVAKLEFSDDQQLQELRLHCHNIFRVGDKIQLLEGVWESAEPQDETAATTATGGCGRCLHIPNVSLHTIAEHAKVVEAAAWSTEKCRPWKVQFFTPQAPTSSSTIRLDPSRPVTKKTHQRSRLLKRQEGEMVTNFIVHMMAWKLNEEDVESDPDEWGAIPRQPSAEVLRALENGVWDVAGGVGLASMSLSLRGIRSTVVDPRSSAGCLSKRERKEYKNALLKSPFLPPYETKQAWVGELPADTKRPLDLAEVTVVNNCCDASFIMALHPDEATEAAVDLAVRHRIPFCVIPCCVFAKLFPNRRMPDGGLVSSYEDLVDYLQAKDSSIQRTTLPFEGANIALWSLF